MTPHGDVNSSALYVCAHMCICVRVCVCVYMRVCMHVYVCVHTGSTSDVTPQALATLFLSQVSQFTRAYSFGQEGWK